MVLEEAEEVELQRQMTAGVESGESQVPGEKGELVEVLHLAVKERQAALFVPFERRRVVHARILLARCGGIPRYSIATQLSISCYTLFK